MLCKISDMIKDLQTVQKQEGDIFMYLACDEEGNNFASIGRVSDTTITVEDEKSINPNMKAEGKCCVIWPLEQFHSGVF